MNLWVNYRVSSANGWGEAKIVDRADHGKVIAVRRFRNGSIVLPTIADWARDTLDGVRSVEWAPVGAGYWSGRINV